MEPLAFVNPEMGVNAGRKSLPAKRLSDHAEISTALNSKELRLGAKADPAEVWR